MKTTLLAITAACCIACFTYSASAAEDVKKDESKAPVATTPKEGKDAAKPETVDPFKVPVNGDSAQLIAFCKSALAEGKKVRSQQEYQEFLKKANPAVSLSCMMILKKEPSETTENARFARRMLLILSIQPMVEAPEEEALKFARAIIAFITVKDMEITRDDIGLVMSAGRMLERKSGPIAKELYASAVPVFKDLKFPQIERIVAGFEGTVRRIDLLGHEMELKGTTIDGKPFDVAALKGKVILVDFWATWCHWCIEEFPNVKKNYAGYHKKGFEVIGISADKERDKLDAYLKDKPLPWIVLHDTDGHNPAMDQYGVVSYPTTFLIGKDGTVKSLSVRGAQLDEWLKKELGEPDPITPEPEAKPVEPTK